VTSALATPNLLTPSGPKPRIELIPAGAVDTYGPDAVALMAAGGRVLDDWQARALDIMLSVGPDGMWTAPEYAEWCARQNGKGDLLEARALAGLFLDLPHPEMLIGWSAHEYRTAMQAYRRLRDRIRKLGIPEPKNSNIINIELNPDEWIQVKFVNANGDEEVERLDTGQRIKFFARSKGAGRGFTGNVLLLDEVFAMTSDHQDAIAPTQLTIANAQTIYTSTPPLDGVTGEIMYGLRERAETGDPELAYRDWGAGGYLEELDGDPKADPPIPAIEVDDQELWKATNPACASGRMPIKNIARYRRKAGKIGFSRETLCIWPRRVRAAEDAVDRELWRYCADPDSVPGSVLVFALDVSPGATTAAIASAGKREDGRLHTKVVTHKPGTAWVIPRLLDLKQRYNPKAIMINSNGPAGALVEAAAGVGLKLTPVNGPEWQRACAAFVADMQEDTLRHCDQEALNDAVGSAARKYVGDGAWYWSRKDSNGDICPLAAATAALHGFRVRSRPARSLGSVG
jgi:hypothetical protein